MKTLTIPKTSGIYAHQTLLNHFFAQKSPNNTVFIQLTGEDFYRLVEGQWDKNMLYQLKDNCLIQNYITFDHVLSAISEIPEFLTPAQVLYIGQVWRQYQ